MMSTTYRLLFLVIQITFSQLTTTGESTTRHDPDYDKYSGRTKEEYEEVVSLLAEYREEVLKLIADPTLPDPVDAGIEDTEDPSALGDILLTPHQARLLLHSVRRQVKEKMTSEANLEKVHASSIHEATNKSEATGGNLTEVRIDTYSEVVKDGPFKIGGDIVLVYNLTHPEIAYQWDFTPKGSNSTIKLGQDQALAKTNLKLEDSGTYKCTAKKGNQTAEATFTVDVVKGSSTSAFKSSACTIIGSSSSYHALVASLLDIWFESCILASWEV